MFEECSSCDAACCRYTFQILKITSKEQNKEQFEYWEFLSLDSWEEDGYIVWKLPRTCRHLDEETNRCMNYEGRPKICRDYPDNRIYKKRTYAHVCERMRNRCKIPIGNAKGFSILKER